MLSHPLKRVQDYLASYWEHCPVVTPRLAYGTPNLLILMHILWYVASVVGQTDRRRCAGATGVNRAAALTSRTEECALELVSSLRDLRLCPTLRSTEQLCGKLALYARKVPQRLKAGRILWNLAARLKPRPFKVILTRILAKGTQSPTQFQKRSLVRRKDSGNQLL